MTEKLQTLLVPHEHTIVIDKSEFITSLFPTDTAEEAKDAIQQVRKLHHTATHNCTAYIIGDPIFIQKTNDDGEPKGTAGIPMLQSMTYKNMTNITAVVTRYFGGIKLGAGGLIRAYAGSVTAALDTAKLATYENVQHYSFSISYDELNGVYFLESSLQNFTIVHVLYDQAITVTIECLEPALTAIKDSFTAHFFREVPFALVQETRTKFPIQL